MKPFDHRDLGTDEKAWALEPRLADSPQLEAPGSGANLVIVAAHPDDETLGAGGLMAEASRRGAAVTVIVATDGEASHPQSPTHAPAELAGRRMEEVAAAVERLAPGARLERLHLPDGRVREHRRAVEVEIAAHLGPETTLVTPWRGDRHPDHEACAIAARNVLRGPPARHWQYPIWFWHWAQPGDDAFPWDTIGRLELSDGALAAKSLAIECHVSQHSALSDLPGDERLLGPEFVDHFRRAYETFVVEPVHAAASRAYFDDLYELADDPWGLATRFYERRKREILLASLPRERFRRAFEPGCATGLITEALALRCDRVVAWDSAARAVELTEERTGNLVNVEVAEGAIPEQWPAGEFDLILLSEVGYYCDDLGALVDAIGRSLSPDGVVVACHWCHPAPDHPKRGSDVHDALGAELRLDVSHAEGDFLLEVWSRAGRSVAQRTGIVA